MAKRLHSVYSAMGVVSFRISKEDEAALTHAGRKPAELAKAAVEDEARRARSRPGARSPRGTLMFVLDASVVAQLGVPGEGSGRFRSWYGDAGRGGASFTAPDLLGGELGRILQKAHPRAAPGELAALHAALLSHTRLVPSPPEETFGLLDAGLGYFRASYVALAMKQGATLATADREMAKAARQAGVGVLEF